MTMEGTWFRTVRPASDAPRRLVVVPHAGSGTVPYAPWGRALAPEIEVVIARLPGREDRWQEPPCATVEQAVEGLAEALEALPPKAYTLFGHSMGSILAFELARELRRGGSRLPENVVLSGSPPPWRRNERPCLSHLPEVEFFERVEALYGAYPESLSADPSLRRLLMDLLRADLAMMERHVHRGARDLEMPLHVLWGASDPATPSGSVDTWHAVGAPVSVHRFPGGHFFHLVESRKAVQELLRMITLTEVAAACPYCASSP